MIRLASYTALFLVAGVMVGCGKHDSPKPAKGAVTYYKGWLSNDPDGGLDQSRSVPVYVIDLGRPTIIGTWCFDGARYWLPVSRGPLHAICDFGPLTSPTPNPKRK